MLNDKEAHVLRLDVREDYVFKNPEFALRIGILMQRRRRQWEGQLLFPLYDRVSSK